MINSYKRHFVFFCVSVAFLLLYPFPVASQEPLLSEKTEISIITVSPGNTLVDAFGHSAIRVEDPKNNLDQVYNYGIYDFEAPNFILNFARGKLLYQLADYPFSYFLNTYRQENRSVISQTLYLTWEEKQDFFNYLQTNALPENRNYLYDFFYDNCATKLPEATQKVLPDKVTFTYNFAKGKDCSFRELIHKYSYEHPWGALGIDLALGAVIDKKAPAENYIFLPEYVYEAYAESKYNGRPLVSETKTLFKAEEKPKKTRIFTPSIVFTLIALVIITITFIDRKRNKRSRGLDFLIFFVTGLIGVFMLLLWFATDHTATAQNYNILWAFAPNIVVSFWMLKKELPIWIRKYAQLLLLLLAVMIVLWIFGVQLFPWALIPVIITLGFRYRYLAGKAAS